MEKIDSKFRWVGSDSNFVDRLDVQDMDGLVLGRFGGNSSAGQYKNEDGCLIWKDSAEDWEFVLLLDAHNTAESAKAVLEQVEAHEQEVKRLLSQPISRYFFRNLESLVLEMFQQEAFLQTCRSVQGETACLIVARKGKYVWWFSVGDCLVYLFHPELKAFGQYQLNQRQFYEWIGEVNTFEQPVPCYSAGTRELREGANRLFLTTDGLVECPGGIYAEPASIYAVNSGRDGIEEMLKKIQEHGVRDSTTIISWEIIVKEAAAMPSNL
ncbi:protein phosphatase 2C domain-containing protein [Planococcus koreensis]|uniref:protein phosphatase 2C domain-containing protein n=1 Tax=Planococcus koreensis TaxID=112331 RepID=UPI0039FCB7C8